MKLSKNKLFTIFGIILLLILAQNIFPQVREYKVHNRGILWQTVYNNGVIGRPFSNWMDAITKFPSPVLMWPGGSQTILDGIEYDGQHCSLGGGLYFGAYDEDGNWIIAVCGGIGTGSNTVPTIGRWNFPIEFYEIDNYPILEDGSLNPDYDPDEAEQIIVAKWATSIGLTVTRTSRQWSYPDYNDMIIYEYEIVYTGDTDGDESTIEMDDEKLTDVIINYMDSFAPSMYGFIRNYGSWITRPGILQGDLYAFFDSDYVLHYTMDLSFKKDTLIAGKPEPTYFREFAETGQNGGGLCSPQAAGYCVLHWSTDHLAVVDMENPDRNESRYGDPEISNIEKAPKPYDENGHVLQPWTIAGQQGWLSESNVTQSKTWAGVVINAIDRGMIGGFYNETYPNEKWWYRPKGMKPQRAKTFLTRTTGWGPYVLHKGDTIRFAVAEVVGYGAEGGKLVDGGFYNIGQLEPAQDWHKKIVAQNGENTSDYLDEFGYPDFVDSEVRNIQQVAHKAFEAYVGHELPYSRQIAEHPIWPEDTPKKGRYTIPVPPPAPVINVENTAYGDVKITWTKAPEEFTHPRLTGELVEYRVYRSYSYIGPWKLLGIVEKGSNLNSEGLYEFYDTDETFKVGDDGYYAVTSVDENGNESGKPNIVYHKKNVGPVEKLGKVYVTPNPFYVESGFTGIGTEKMIGFYGLPKKCTIRIYSLGGQLVQTIEHDDPSYSHTWMQVSNNRQDIASGVYIYVVTTPEGEQTTGKFVVIK